ncbi:MAG: hypothetical protein DLM59_10250, partial [Pseudonocardiales bacterium]
MVPTLSIVTLGHRESRLRPGPAERDHGLSGGGVMLCRMNEIPAENYSPTWAEGSRQPALLLGDERAVLTGFLDWHRETFALKCAGVPPERLSERGVPPSG